MLQRCGVQTYNTRTHRLTTVRRKKSWFTRLRWEPARVRQEGVRRRAASLHTREMYHWRNFCSNVRIHVLYLHLIRYRPAAQSNGQFYGCRVTQHLAVLDWDKKLPSKVVIVYLRKLRSPEVIALLSNKKIYNKMNRDEKLIAPPRGVFIFVLRWIQLFYSCANFITFIITFRKNSSLLPFSDDSHRFPLILKVTHFQIFNFHPGLQWSSHYSLFN